MFDINQNLTRRDVTSTQYALSDFLGIPVEDLHIIGSGHNYDRARNINLLLDARRYSLKKVKDLLNLYKSNNGVRGPWQPDYYFPVGGNGIDYSGADGQAAAVDVSETYNPTWSLFINRQGGGSTYKGIARYQFIKESIPMLINDPEYDQIITSGGEPIAVAGRRLTQHQGLTRVYAIRPRNTDGSFRPKWVEVDYAKLVTFYPEFSVSASPLTIKHPDQFANMYANVAHDRLSTVEGIIESTEFVLPTREQVRILKKISTQHK
jgi:hypothetical protein